MNEQERKERLRELYAELRGHIDEIQERFGVGEGEATMSKQENERVRELPDLEGVRELLEKGRPLTEQETAYAVKQLNGATKMRQDLIVRLKEIREVVREANREVKKL